MSQIVEKYLEQFPEHKYLHYHAPRYSTLLNLVQQEYQEGDRILDIGRSQLTEMAVTALNTSVDTLGFAQDEDTDLGKHYHFNLNNSQEPNLWRKDLEPYDLIIFAEVIEHLYTSPNFVLSFLNSITAVGGRIILQTPNAVALHKRIKILLGKHPYEKIREDNTNPGHFREYTKQELINYSKNTGFKLKNILYGNYFDYRYQDIPERPEVKYQPKLKLINDFYSLCPASYKPGLTCVLVKEGESNFILQLASKNQLAQ